MPKTTKLTAEQFIAKHGLPIRRVNCLLDVACSACGHRAVRVRAASWWDLDDDGLGDNGDVEWGATNAACCASCGEEHRYGWFCIEGLDALVQAKAAMAVVTKPNDEGW